MMCCLGAPFVILFSWPKLIIYKIEYTPNNSFGFAVDDEGIMQASSANQNQHLTVASVEIHGI